MSEQRELYSCIDSATTFKIWKEINSELMASNPGYHQIYRQTMDLYDPTIFMSTMGLRVDLDALEREKQRVTAAIEQKQAELNNITSGKLNPLSPKSCQSYFYGTLGLQPYRKKGSITCDDKAMSRIARRGYKEARIVQAIRSLHKLYSTYLDVRLDPDGRIRSSWNLRGTREGRLSSSENIFGTGLNFQNLHPQFKPFIVADPGMCFVEIDKRQAEWVVVAYLANDARMIEVIEKGVDPHAYTASLLCGTSMELIKAESELLKHTTDPDLIAQARAEFLPELVANAHFLPRTMTCRQAGKKGNHGLNYKEEYRTFALTNEIPEAEAMVIVKGYRSGYPNIPLWWDATIGEMRSNNRILRNCFNRPRRFLGEWNDELFRAAIAFKPQSTVVDLINRGMTKIYHDPAPFMQPLALGAQVHDSLLIQYPIDRIPELAHACLQMHSHINPVMRYSGHDFQIASDITIGLNWGASDKNNPNGMREINFELNSGNADVLTEKLLAVVNQWR